MAKHKEPLKEKEIKILCADDNPHDLELVKNLLEEEGHKVSTVCSGKDCLKKFKNEKFDLILLDAMMPELSGWDTLNKIMAQDRKQKVALITIMQVSDGRRQALLSQGLNEYIVKPFSKETFLSKIRKILDSK